jgi:hypothetical protein
MTPFSVRLMWWGILMFVCAGLAAGAGPGFLSGFFGMLALIGAAAGALGFILLILEILSFK